MSVSFEFTKRHDIQHALLSVRCKVDNSSLQVTTAHLRPFSELADRLQATERAKKNAERLATGYPDLVVILQEPTDKAENLEYDNMVKTSPTLSHYDKILKRYSFGRRTLDNTIILDARTFRSARLQNEQEEPERIRGNEMAYATLESVLALLHPKVILVSQCVSSDADNALARELCSSVARAGESELITLPNAHDSVLVYSFHPMYFMRLCEELMQELGQNLFDLTVAIALNALHGRQVVGFSLSNLRDTVIHGGPMITPDGVSYEYLSDKDAASDELLQMLKACGLDSPTEETQKLDQLFSQRYNEWIAKTHFTTSLCS